MYESPATASESAAATPDATSSARAKGIVSRRATAPLASGPALVESATGTGALRLSVVASAVTVGAAFGIVGLAGDAGTTESGGILTILAGLRLATGCSNNC